MLLIFTNRTFSYVTQTIYTCVRRHGAMAFINWLVSQTLINPIMFFELSTSALIRSKVFKLGLQIIHVGINAGVCS